MSKNELLGALSGMAICISITTIVETFIPFHSIPLGLLLGGGSTLIGAWIGFKQDLRNRG